MTKVDERMKALREQMNRARMRLAAERMDRRVREFERSAAVRAEEAECGPGTARPIGELSQQLMSALADIERGDVEEMTVDEFRVALRRRTLDS